MATNGIAEVTVIFPIFIRIFDARLLGWAVHIVTSPTDTILTLATSSINERRLRSQSQAEAEVNNPPLAAIAQVFGRILNQVPDLIELTGYYRCPGDGGQLSPKAQGLACVLCNRRFPLQTQGIIDFDIVKSDQRMAFDEQQRGKRVLSTAETEASRTVADRFLTTAGLLLHGTLENKNILDLACGTGQVTVGLYLHEHIRHCKIFGFDHSLQSLQVLANTLSNLSSTNTVYLSAQDVTRLAYADRMFDLVVGDAVLHHFVNFSETLEHVLRLLKPRGRAIFAEPFAYGYLLAMTILKIATHEVKRTRAILPDMGMYDFIVGNIAYRARHYDDPSKLEGLTDKHLFREQHIMSLGNQLGFSVRFENYADDTYYDGFMRDILRTYNIANRNVADRADELYQVVRDYLKEALPDYFAHFRFIVMEKDVKTES